MRTDHWHRQQVLSIRAAPFRVPAPPNDPREAGRAVARMLGAEPEAPPWPKQPCEMSEGAAALLEEMRAREATRRG